MHSEVIKMFQKNQRPWNKGRQLRQRKLPSRRFFQQGNTNRSKASAEVHGTTRKRFFVRLSAGDHALVTRPSLDCQSYITPDCDGERILMYSSPTVRKLQTPLRHSTCIMRFIKRDQAVIHQQPTSLSHMPFKTLPSGPRS